jgi:molybdopterin/thiamine biosynthesis adenylyltransferase
VTARVVFFGVGALGSHAAIACRNLDAVLSFVDFDRVESKNLLSQAFVKASVGKNKADALKAQLQSFWGVRAESFGVRFSEDNAATLLSGATLAVDAFDNAESRRLLSAAARSRGVPLVHAGVSGDGTFGLVRWDERFVPDEEDHAGAATCEGGGHLPLLGLVSAALARVIQDFVERGEERDVLVSLTAVTPTT